MVECGLVALGLGYGLVALWLAMALWPRDWAVA